MILLGPHIKSYIEVEGVILHIRSVTVKKFVSNNVLERFLGEFGAS